MTLMKNKQLAMVLNIHPQKVGQALDPAFRKLAPNFLADPGRACAMLAEAIDDARAEIAARGITLPGNGRPRPVPA